MSSRITFAVGENEAKQPFPGFSRLDKTQQVSNLHQRENEGTVGPEICNASSVWVKVKEPAKG